MSARVSEPADEIGAVRAAQLLGMSVPKFHEAVRDKHLPQALHGEQPMNAWRWNAGEILAIAAKHPQGFIAPVPDRKAPVREPATVQIRRAAEILRMPMPIFAGMVDDPNEADMPRRIFAPATGMISDRIFVNGLHLWCQKHKPGALGRLEEWMRDQHVAFEADGQVYSQPRV